MKWARLLWAGIAASIASYFVYFVIGSFFSGLYEPVSGLWRAMSTPYWLQNVIIAMLAVQFLTVFGYAQTHTSLGKRAEMGKKGLKFGLLLWILRDIPIGIFVFTLMPVPGKLVFVWIGSGFIADMLSGLAVARIYR